MDFSDRISFTPLYNKESLEEMYLDISESVESASHNSPKKSTEPGYRRIRNFQSRYLQKFHRFFKCRVVPESAHEALEAAECKLKELVDDFGGDLHVCKLSGKNYVTAYFIVNSEEDAQNWASQLEYSISPYIQSGHKPTLLEMNNLN